MRHQLRVVILFIFGLSNSVAQTVEIAVIGAKIYTSPQANPISDGTVVMANGKITAVGTRQQVRVASDATLIDGRGMTVMAGFWNCHVHLIEPHWQHTDTLSVTRLNRQLTDMFTCYGFSYTVDLAALDRSNLLALRRRIESGEVVGPTLLMAGVPFTPAKGSPYYIAPLKLPELSTPQQAVDHVNEQLDAGADVIKLWSASPTGRMIVPMPPDVLKAAVAAAHARQKPVVAHPTSLEGVRIAIDGGVDILAHVAAADYQPWDRALIQRMLASGVALIPTMKLHQWDLERTGVKSVNHPLVNTAVDQLRAYAQAGGEVLFGTDVGYMTDYSPADEYKLMAQAEMRFPQILAALTTAPARRFGRAERTGTVAVGRDADLTIVSGDPAVDTKTLTNVTFTIHRGKVIYKRD